jgi:hypothetical protein
MVDDEEEDGPDDEREVIESASTGKEAVAETVTVEEEDGQEADEEMAFDEYAPFEYKDAERYANSG